MICVAYNCDYLVQKHSRILQSFNDANFIKIVCDWQVTTDHNSVGADLPRNQSQSAVTQTCKQLQTMILNKRTRQLWQKRFVNNILKRH